jgi:hypothetical protein
MNSRDYALRHMVRNGKMPHLNATVIPLTANVNLSSKLRTRHKIAVALLQRLGLTYVRIEPDSDGRYCYVAWNAPMIGNGCLPVSKRGSGPDNVLCCQPCRGKNVISEHNPPHLHREYGDGIHPLAVNEEGHLEPFAEFDYASIDGREPPVETVEYPDMLAAFCLILEWINSAEKHRDLSGVGGRAAALLFFLRPTQSSFRSLEAIAVFAGVSRAGLSKALMKLRDETGLRSWMLSSPYGARETYRQAQLTIRANGTRKAKDHVSAAADAPMDACVQVDGDALDRT